VARAFIFAIFAIGAHNLFGVARTNFFAAQLAAQLAALLAALLVAYVVIPGLQSWLHSW